MGADFTQIKDKATHNVDIAYDYRFFFEYMVDNIHADCKKYQQPYKIPPKDNDKIVLTKYFEKASINDLNKYSKLANITPSLRCYCLDALLYRWFTNKDKDDNQIYSIATPDEPKYSTNNLNEFLMVDSIKYMLLDNNTVSLSEGLFGMNTVSMLIFHHIIHYLTNDINNYIQNYIFTKYNIINQNNDDDNVSFVDQMNAKNNMDDDNNKNNNNNNNDNNNNNNIIINYDMIFELLKNNALRNQSSLNYELLNKMMLYHSNDINKKLSWRYIPIIAAYKDNDDIPFIQSLLDQGPSKKSWFYAMDAVQKFPNDSFWKYLDEFFKKIYSHITLVNGETVPINLKQALIDNKAQNKKKNDHNHNHNHLDNNDHDIKDNNDDDDNDNNSDKDDKKVDASLLIEGQNNDDNDGVNDINDNLVNNDLNVDYVSIVDESQYYDITTQMRFISTLCSYSINNPRGITLYNDGVCGNIHHLLDIPKANTSSSYYTDNMIYLLSCIPLHSSMKTVIFRIWKSYGICSWRHLNVLIYESSINKLSFKMFLLGTNKRVGKQSNILKIAGSQLILKNIYSFLKDKECIESFKLLSNYDNIIWWSAIKDDDIYIMDTLQSIQNLFYVLNKLQLKNRFILYKKFKEKHNSKIVEKYITSKFDAVYTKQTLSKN